MNFKLIKLYLPLIFFSFTQCSKGQQTITGTFPQLANQIVKLESFNSFETSIIDSARVNKNGAFQLTYSPKDYGMGYLIAKDKKPFIVVPELFSR